MLLKTQKNPSLTRSIDKTHLLNLMKNHHLHYLNLMKNHQLYHLTAVKDHQENQVKEKNVKHPNAKHLSANQENLDVNVYFL